MFPFLSHLRRRRAADNAAAPGNRSECGGPEDGTGRDAGVGSSPEQAIGRRLAEVEQELTGVAAGASLCTLSRSGGPVDGAKHLEGRAAALRQLRREVRDRRGAATGATPDVADVAADLALEWSDQLDAAVAGDRGRSWIAYRAGGVDELRALSVPRATGPAGRGEP